ncbi:hypothetical protein DSLPV1_064 [Dishui lake phycodnavirus 1]|uniref:hypothetical protein n=1 Tax=Dishui lake phycodnavirus 1 TaxID=2079134 RepID=UPI000CD6892D|nr:hypothetical protein C5Y57_gp064 [Dishui lake phycodnavirus 1]AUT19035.1 hypothetical protein DSLPV1_064 [Dishui lake phycodnavirus 1]
MSLSSDNVGYLDISNAILRVGTLDVVGLQGVDTVTNTLRANSVLVYDDMGTDIATPPFTLGAGVSRSTSPTEIELRYASGNNFMYKGIKLPNFFVGEFELYAADTATGNVFLHTYTESTTSYGNDGYEFIFDFQYNTITLKYDGTQIAQGTSAGLTASTWHRISVMYDRNVWTVSVDGAVKFVLDDVERAAVYENPTTGQYLRFATNSGTSRKIRAIKFMNGSYWSQSKLGHLSYTNGNVGIGTYAPTTHRFEVFGSAKTQNIDATTLALSSTTASSSTSTGALTVAGGIGAREVYSGNAYCSNVFTQVSQQGSSSDRITTVRLNEFNESGNDRWWKLATLFAGAGGTWSYIRGIITMNRVNESYRTYEFGVWGVPSAPDNTFIYTPVNVTGDQDYFTNHNYLVIYNNTANSTVDVYLKAASYSRVKIELDYTNLTALYLQPNWTTTAPTTSGTYILKYWPPTSKNSLITVNNKLGINVNYPSEALHVGGNIRLGNPLGSDDNADYYISTAGQLNIHSNDTSDTDPDYRYFNLVCGPTSNLLNTAAIQIGSHSDCSVRTYSRNYVVSKQNTTGNSNGTITLYDHSGIGSNVYVDGQGNIMRYYVIGGVQYNGGIHLTGNAVLPAYNGGADSAKNVDLGVPDYRWRSTYARYYNAYDSTTAVVTSELANFGRTVTSNGGSDASFLSIGKIIEDSSQTGWLGYSSRLSQVVNNVTMSSVRFNGYNNHGGLSIETGYSDGGSPEYLKSTATFTSRGSVGIGTTTPFNVPFGGGLTSALGGLHVEQAVVSGAGEGYYLNSHYSIATGSNQYQGYGKIYYDPGQLDHAVPIAGMMIENTTTNSAGTPYNYSQRLLFKTHDYGLYGGLLNDCAMACNTDGKVSMRRYSYTQPLSKLHVEDNGFAFTVSGTRDTNQTYSMMRLGHPWSVSYGDYCSIFESYNNWAVDYKSALTIYTHTNTSEYDQGGYNITGLTLRDGYAGICGGINTGYSVTIAGGNGSIFSYGFWVRNTYGNNHWREGTGDNANYTSYNSVFFVWWGMAWMDFQSTVRMVYNARAGDLDMLGTCHAAAFSTASDDRVKDFEKPLHLGTETLLKLNPQHYYKRDKLELSTKVKYREEFGLIAQDVYYDAPELRPLVHLHYDADPSPEKPVRDENIQIDPPYDDWGSQIASLELEGLIPIMINSIKEIVTEKDAVKTRVTDVAFSNVVDHRGLVVCARNDAFSPKSGKPLVELSSRIACKAWYGVITGSNVHTEDSETLIARGGDAKVWVIMRNGASVESGDLLCTSNVHGYVWKQDDDLVRSSTVAKLTQGCAFTVPVPRPKKKIRRELRDVTYYIKRRWYKTDKEDHDKMPEHKRRTYLEDYYEKTDYEYRPKSHMRKDDDGEWNVVVFIKELRYEISRETYNALSADAKAAYRPTNVDDKYVRIERQMATQEAYDLMTEAERADYVEYQAKGNKTEKTIDEWNALDAAEKAKYVLKIRRVYERMEQWVAKDPLITNTTVETKQEMVDVLDEYGQHIYDDDPDETELPYEIRYLTTQGMITTRHSAVYYAALLSCTLMG